MKILGDSMVVQTVSCVAVCVQGARVSSYDTHLATEFYHTIFENIMDIFGYLGGGWGGWGIPLAVVDESFLIGMLWNGNNT